MGYKLTDPCIKKAFEDERLFVLMARDPSAPFVVIDWISRNLGVQPAEKLHEALDAAIEMHKRCGEFRHRKLRTPDQPDSGGSIHPEQGNYM